MGRSEPQFVVGVSSKSIMRHSLPLVQRRAEAPIIGADAINQLGAPRAPADLELHASAAVHRRGALYAWTLASGAWSHIVLERLADVAVIEIEGHRQTLGTQASRAPSARGIGIIEMMSICRLSFILCGLSSQAKALKIALPLGVPSPVQAFQPGPAW